MSFVLTVASIKQEGDQMAPSRQLFDCLLLVVSLRNNLGSITRIIFVHHGLYTHGCDSTSHNYKNFFSVLQNNMLERKSMLSTHTTSEINSPRTFLFSFLVFKLLTKADLIFAFVAPSSTSNSLF